MQAVQDYLVVEPLVSYTNIGEIVPDSIEEVIGYSKQTNCSKGMKRTHLTILSRECVNKFFDNCTIKDRIMKKMNINLLSSLFWEEHSIFIYILFNEKLH